MGSREAGDLTLMAKGHLFSREWAFVVPLKHVAVLSPLVDHGEVEHREHFQSLLLLLVIYKGGFFVSRTATLLWKRTAV